MPEISRFFGIIITMFYRDHNPPHFHVRYGGQLGLVSLTDLEQLDGNLSPRVLGLVRDWAELHRDELDRNWQAARASQPLLPIEPLE